MFKTKPYSALLGLSVLLGACSTPPPNPPEDRLMREMHGVASMPSAYQEGYRAGCASGLYTAGYNSYHFDKDLGKMRLNPYKQGWEDGYKTCQARQAQRHYVEPVRPRVTIIEPHRWDERRRHPR